MLGFIMDQPTRVMAIALIAAVAVAILNVLGRFVLGFSGLGATIVIAAVVAASVMLWYVKRLKRPPTPAERSRFLWVYSGLLAVGVMAILAFSGSTPSTPGLFILVLHYLAYPAFAQMLLSEKMFESLLQ